jgi:hypothetical protein
LTEQNQASGLFVSRCLNYDLVESGQSWDEAWANLKIVMKNHIEFHAAHRPDALQNDRQADKELWDKFYQLIQKNGVIVEQLALDIEEPKHDNTYEGIWIVGSPQVMHDRAVPVV